MYDPLVINWGSTPDEMNLQLPGEEMIDETTCRTTKAVSIRAHGNEIWYWLRHPEPEFFAEDGSRFPFEELDVGDIVNFHPRGSMMLARVLPDKTLVFIRNENGKRTIVNNAPLLVCWILHVYHSPSGDTRLISRLRYHEPHSIQAVIDNYMIHLYSFLSERKLLLRIKRSAEKQTERYRLPI